MDENVIYMLFSWQHHLALKRILAASILKSAHFHGLDLLKFTLVTYLVIATKFSCYLGVLFPYTFSYMRSMYLHEGYAKYQISEFASGFLGVMQKE